MRYVIFVRTGGYMLLAAPIMVLNILLQRNLFIHIHEPVIRTTILNFSISQLKIKLEAV